MTKEQEEYKASQAITWIDTLPQKISLWLKEGAIAYNLDITKTDAAVAMAQIEEILGNILHKDRCRMVEICGESIDTMPKLGVLPNQAMSGFSVRREMEKL